MKGKLRDKERLNHIIEAIDNVIEFVDGKTFNDFKKDTILRFAIIEKELVPLKQKLQKLISEF